MSRASRVARLAAALVPSGPPAVRFVDQHVHPTGPPLPSDAEVSVECDRLQGEGFHVILMRTVYTAHSIANGHGPWTA